MVTKLNREYLLTYIPATQEGYVGDRMLEIKNPITIEFNIKRDLFSAVNEMVLDVYNLSPENRDFLYQDLQSQMAYCYLEAGYQGWAKSLVFAGNVWNTFSRHAGTNVITRITARDGFNAIQINTNQTFNAGSTTEDIVNTLQQSMGLSKGVYGFKNYTFARPVEIIGNSFLALQKYVDRNAYIDLGELNILDTNQVKKSEVVVIDDSAGLLGTPERSNAVLTINIMFEPRVQVGQLIELRSSVEPRYNGQYKICGISHNGMISDTIAGRATTTLQLWTEATNFGGFSVINKS